MCARPANRRVPLAVLLAALIVLAGCSVPSDTGIGSASDGTLTPVEVPDDADIAGSGSVEALAPGLTDAGVVDPTRLGTAHARVLENVSYTFRRNITRREPDGTLVLGTDTVLRRTADGGRFRYTLRFRGRERRVVDRYADGARIYECESTPNGTTYALFRIGNDPIDPRNASFGALTGRRGVIDLFTRFRFDVQDRVDLNGTTHYRLATTAPRDLPPLRDISVRALVSERGLVREYRVAYRAVRGDEAVRVNVTVAVSDIGSTTVTEPGWYDDALVATTTTETVAERDCVAR